MTQSSAVWLVIILSIITANLPFIIQKPLLVLPWNQGKAGLITNNYLLQWLYSLLFFASLVAVSYLFYELIANSLVFNSTASIMLFLSKILAFAILISLLMIISVRFTKTEITTTKNLSTGFAANLAANHKPFFSRLLEIFVLYILCGVLALALEANIGNLFPKTWEFYAITSSLYLVMAYPGFVVRYLVRKRKIRTNYNTLQHNNV